LQNFIVHDGQWYFARHQDNNLKAIIAFAEFTKQVKDNPWPFVDLVKLIQNSRMKDGQVVELLKIANGYLHRVRLECDRLKEEKSSLEAELNSWKAELSNTVRIYQGFCDRNIVLRRREDALQLSINKLEAKEAKLNKSLSQTLHVPHIEDGTSSVEGGLLIIGRYHSSKRTTETNIGTNTAALLSSYLLEVVSVYFL
jgi:hypothetical protein